MGGMVTVVTVHGIEAPGVTIEALPSKLAVQMRAPSNALLSASPPRPLETVFTTPAAWVGSMRYTRPGLMLAATRTLPIAASAAVALVAPVHVPSSRPSLPRTRETVPAVELGTPTAAPSDRRSLGPAPTVVRPSAVELWEVQNWSRAARRLPRFKAPSTVRERNAAIWRRETLAAGSYVVAVVPVVIPR